MRPRTTGAKLGTVFGAILLASCGGGGGQPQATYGAGCAGAAYPEPATSPYVLPWPVGRTHLTGLTNCASSFHAQGQPDQWAFDFQMGADTPFVAVRAGTVSVVVDDQPSHGGGDGNYVVVDHGDGTSAVYLHAPRQGIRVRVGDNVVQGQVLGVVGQSGLAGYPHLHLIVVAGSPVYPYTGVPISFRNASPPDRMLLGNRPYTALPY